MLDYVRQNYTDYVKDKYKDTQLFSPDKFEMKPVRTLVIRFLKDNEKYGSLKKHFIEQYVLQFMCVYGGWDEDDLEKFIFKN
jgi:hypothetical protein